MLSRAEASGTGLMTNYDVPIAISGTHEDTTTSMLSHIRWPARWITISVGGILKAIGGI